MDNTIHMMSATSVYADDTRNPDNTIQLAMCGAPIGPYAEASKVHPYYNVAGVTCEPCRARVGGAE